MLCATGILLALFEREKSGKGQVIDSAMVDGTSHLITFIHKFRSMGLWNDEPGTITNLYGLIWWNVSVPNVPLILTPAEY